MNQMNQNGQPNKELLKQALENLLNQESCGERKSKRDEEKSNLMSLL